ncbi:hypothetical protein ACPDHL_00830 [Myroides sp. C15-4]|uniref:hypothetical protein n=1 Tax=Myroides sp. C15-4 TaxID=3400532 RepID=UPI003D2F6EDD
MKKIELLILSLLVSVVSFSQPNSIYVKTKYLADEVIKKLEFTQPYTVTDRTPVTFVEKESIKDFTGSEYAKTPWYGATAGKEFIVVEYADPNQQTEWGYLYQVYFWKDHTLPFFVNRGDGMGLNLKYNGTSQPYFRVHYATDLQIFKYPSLVEPNQELTLQYLESEWVDASDWVTVTSYEFRPDKSRGVELISRTEEPLRGNILITYKIKVIADDAWVIIEKTQDGYDLNPL